MELSVVAPLLHILLNLYLYDMTLDSQTGSGENYCLNLSNRLL